MFNGNNDKFSVQGSTFKLAAFACAQGNVAAQAVDLSPHQGQTVRIYLDGDLRIGSTRRKTCIGNWRNDPSGASKSPVQQGTVRVKKRSRRQSCGAKRTLTPCRASTGGRYPLLAITGRTAQRNRMAGRGNRGALDRREIPQTGEEYPVELKEISEEPHMVSIADPLDLNGVMIQVFENPG